MSVRPVARRALVWVLTTAIAAAGLVLGEAPAGAEAGLRSSITDVIAPEGDGTTIMTFELELSEPHDADLSWEVYLGVQHDEDGWASADDVEVADTLVSIPAGQVAAEIDVLVTGDELVEPTELFWLTAHSLDDEALDLDAVGEGAIVDDDVVRIDVVRDAIASESTGELLFQVVLSERARRDVHVHYRTVAGTAGADDAWIGEAETTIPWGASSGVIRVSVTDDDAIEADETLTLELLDSSAELGDTTATGMIVNDDHVVPNVGVADATAVEGDAMTFTVALSEPTTALVTVDYTTADSTSAGGAKHGRDFLMRSGTLTFEPGVTEQTVTVPTVEDVVLELPESFRFVLTGVDAATLVDQRANGTIEDDDPIRLGSLL